MTDWAFALPDNCSQLKQFLTHPKQTLLSETFQNDIQHQQSRHNMQHDVNKAITKFCMAGNAAAAVNENQMGFSKVTL